MIDRIEELLAEMAEEDERKREDILALPAGEKAVPAFSHRDEKAGEAGTDDRSGGRTAGEIAPDQPGPMTGGIGDGLTGDGSGGQAAGMLCKDRAQTVESTGRTAQAVKMLRQARDGGTAWTGLNAERTARTEEIPQTARNTEPVWTGPGQAVRGGPGSAAESAEQAVRGGLGSAAESAEQAGLKGLYRQSVQGLRSAAPALLPEQAGRTARAQEAVSAASLTMDELDRAVRRDSRRYDGGMSIF